MPPFDEPGDRASWGAPSTYAGTVCTVADAGQTAEPERCSMVISHVWSSCMRNTRSSAMNCDGKRSLQTTNINRFSLPIPKV